jgi:hypothetical protein|tara:strand:+ start:3680 stop:4084 length:405 start_codon:yes stop_codon:yes gene_type:complete
MEDDFYATIKLKSGEEIYTKVAPCYEEDKTLLLITNPITLESIHGPRGLSGYKLEPWLKTTKDDMFVIDMDNVMTVSESKDIEMIMMYQAWVREADAQQKDPSGIRKKINGKMGYKGNVADTKEVLEKLFEKDQ